MKPSIRDSSNISMNSRDVSTNKGVRRRRENTKQIVEEALSIFKDQIQVMIDNKMSEIGSMQESQDKQMGTFGKDIYEFRIFLESTVKSEMD